MRYWVYINDKVEGPYDEDRLAAVPGFTPDTLICSEEVEEGGGQEWIKASAVFAFDPVQTAASQPAPAAVQEAAQETAPQAQPSDGLSQLLLEKLDRLTQQIETLQNKVDQVIASGAAAAVRPSADNQEPAQFTAQEEAQAKTITLTQADLTAQPPAQEPSAAGEPVVEEGIITNTESLMSQAETLVAQAQSTQEAPLNALPAEDVLGKDGDEVVLRSALDSLYQGSLKESEEIKESTFQELLTPKQSEDLQNTLKHPLPANQEEQAAGKEALLNELTASQPVQDNIIDQVIEEKIAQEKPQTQEQPVQEVQHPAGMQTAAQEAADAPASELPSMNTAAAEEPAPAPRQEPAPADKPADTPLAEDKQSLDLEGHEELSIAQTPDDTAPEKTVTDARMTQVVAKELQYNTPNGLPSVEDAGAKPGAVQETQNAEETMQELVPGAKIEKPDNAPLITEEDLRDAFTERAPVEEMTIAQEINAAEPEEAQPQAAREQEAPAFEQAQEPLPEAQSYNNANDLTEIELKEGSTYLISDFVPPAQANGNELPKELNALNKANVQADSGENKNKEAAQTADIFEEVVPQVQKTQQQSTPENVVPVPDVTLSKVILENTIKTKRGASLDIKTVPMVPDPAQSPRLDLSDADLEDFNAQHDVKSADVKPAGKSTKMLLGLLAALLIAAVIYVMLAFMEIIPPQFNLLKNSSRTQEIQHREQTEQMNEMLGQNAALPETAGQLTPEQEAAATKEAVITQVQNYVLPNGMTLKELIESRHPAMVNMTEWDATTAVEPDNYSVSVKMPPENPQSFRILYRFNYNTVTNELNPTLSESKNLLDSASAPAAAN